MCCKGGVLSYSIQELTAFFFWFINYVFCWDSKIIKPIDCCEIDSKTSSHDFLSQSTNTNSPVFLSYTFTDN